MTIADNARNLAISLEAKKDALSQRQSGDWKVSFTVQGVDMDARLTQAPMGTRYAMVLVEIGDDETPVQRPAKENKTSVATAPRQDPKSAGGKRDWRDLQPSAQAGIRCAEPQFRAFLREVKGQPNADETEAAVAVRFICGVNSRVELGTRHAARMLWKQLDDQFQAWLQMERVGA